METSERFPIGTFPTFRLLFDIFMLFTWELKFYWSIKELF